MKKIFIPLFIITLITTPILAKTNNQNKENSNLNTNEKIDSIYVLQKKIYKTVKNQPLADKKYGIEFNIFRLLFFASDMNFLNHTLSGGFSLFNVDRKAEIAFPFFYSNPDFKWDEMDIDEKDLYRKFTIGCHYRRFLGNFQNGFYISGFTQYANLQTREYTDEDVKLSNTENKLGLGIGIGYRKFSYKGFYWGTGLSVGRYIIRDDDDYNDGGTLFDFSEIIFNFELLKFGWAF